MYEFQTNVAGDTFKVVCVDTGNCVETVFSVSTDDGAQHQIARHIYPKNRVADAADRAMAKAIEYTDAVKRDAAFEAAL